MNVACGHGETETHPNGTIRCGKCGKWASIDGIAALEAENAALRAALSVERIEPAIFKGIREARRNGQTKDEQVVARIVAALAALNVEESRKPGACPTCGAEPMAPLFQADSQGQPFLTAHGEHATATSEESR